MHHDPLIMEKRGNALRAVSREAADALAKIEDGQRIAIKLLRKRSIAQNSLYWTILNRVVEATGKWNTAEQLHTALKVATGHVDVVRLIDGRRVLVPESTAFDSMSQDEAQAFYDAAFRVIADDLGIALDDLLAHTGGEAIAA